MGMKSVSRDVGKLEFTLLRVKALEHSSQEERLNSRAAAAEFSQGWSERSERNPWIAGKK